MCVQVSGDIINGQELGAFWPFASYTTEEMTEKSLLNLSFKSRSIPRQVPLKRLFELMHRRKRSLAGEVLTEING